MMPAPDRSPLISWWPRPAEPVPADELASQDRLIRIPGRGPARLAVLVFLTLTWAATGSAMLLASVTSQLPTVIATAAVLATASVVVMRAWVLGTYVNDHGYVVRRCWRTCRGSWSEVVQIDASNDRVILVGSSGRVPTHLHRWSVDILGSTERLQAATDQLRRWHEQR